MGTPSDEGPTSPTRRPKWAVIVCAGCASLIVAWFALHVVPSKIGPGWEWTCATCSTAFRHKDVAFPGRRQEVWQQAPRHDHQWEWTAGSCSCPLWSPCHWGGRLDPPDPQRLFAQLLSNLERAGATREPAGASAR